MNFFFTCIKEQTQKYKFEIWLLKSTILDPQTSAFLVIKENPPKKFVFLFRLWFSFKNNRRTNVFLVSNFKTQKKKLLTPKNAILAIFSS